MVALLLAQRHTAVQTKTAPMLKMSHLAVKVGFAQTVEKLLLTHGLKRKKTYCQKPNGNT